MLMVALVVFLLICAVIFEPNDDSPPAVGELHYGKKCTCSVHCSNRCEPEHCSRGVWCHCCCHAEEYRRGMARQTKAA
jgi:hypothetical protein